jgi:hypothetical protein
MSPANLANKNELAGRMPSELLHTTDTEPLAGEDLLKHRDLLAFSGQDSRDNLLGEFSTELLIEHHTKATSVFMHGFCIQVSGEDLTPYRHASQRIWSLLQRFGTVQRGGMDEAFLDATSEVCLPENFSMKAPFVLRI